MSAYTQKHCRFGITQKCVIYHFTYLSTGDNEEIDSTERYDVKVAISADGRHVVSLSFNWWSKLDKGIVKAKRHDC